MVILWPRVRRKRQSGLKGGKNSVSQELHLDVISQLLWQHINAKLVEEPRLERISKDR